MADDAVTPEEQQIIDRARAFAARSIEPLAERWERERRFAAEAFADLPTAGLTALVVPAELGGAGAGAVALAHVLETMAAADLAAAFSAVVHNNMARAVAASDNQTLVNDVLPDLISGRLLGAFLLTEPGVGSDAAAIACTAARDGDHWIINGEKAWVTNGSHAGALNLYAQTGSSHRDIVSIVVDPTQPGVERTEPYELLGGHAMGTGGFTFTDVRVPVAMTLAPVGRAFAGAMAGIDLARVLVGAMCCGMVRRSLDVAVAYTADRQVFGSSVSDKQGVRWMLADVATDLEAMRLLTFRAARQIQDGEDATLTAAHAKKFSTRAAEHHIAQCMQVMGASGYRRDTPVVALDGGPLHGESAGSVTALGEASAGNPLPRHLAAAKLTGYIDGATEVQNVVIARRLWAGADAGRQPSVSS